MKILTSSNVHSYLPILIGVSAFNLSVNNTTSLEFTEEYVINQETPLDLNTGKYIDILSFSEMSKQIIIESQLESYYNAWKEETLIISNVNEIIQNSNFQKIIMIGEMAIPFILKKISAEPSTLVWALNIITGKKISDRSRITISESCNMWYKWGSKSGLV